MNTKNITFRALGSRKFLPRWVGAFEVAAKVDTVAYRLALNPNFKIHDVFHVKLLRPYHENSAHSPPPPTLVGREEFYDVESILDFQPKPLDKRPKRS